MGHRSGYVDEDQIPISEAQKCNQDETHRPCVVVEFMTPRS